MLDSMKLKAILLRYAPEVDAAEDGIFQSPWQSTETFYRLTEEYVALEKRAAYKHDLEHMFPGKKAVL